MSGEKRAQGVEGRGEDAAGPAGRALDGYFYQLDVSILVALDLLLARKVSHKLVLEPASQEDLELDVEDEPGVLAGGVELDGYRLVVQCKLKTTGPWKRWSIRKVLTHGTRRPSAAKRLQDPNVRYVLVTNADVDGAAHGLCIKEVGAWPGAADMPVSIARRLPETAPGRVAILGGMDLERVSTRTERLLTERFRLPRVNLTALRESLQREALLRMRGAGDGAWTREELESSVIAHGGFLGESRDLAGFVRPTNWLQLRQTLSREHAVIITGASGTGKTQAAKALIAELRDEVPGISVIRVDGGPEKVHREQHRPVVFEVEDPWGQFRLEPSAIPWNNAIDEVLRSAGPDRKFVITSRSDVLKESGPRRLRAKWVVQLEAENYGRRERIKLFLNRLERLPRGLQSLVKKHLRAAINRLETPLEMERYFAELEDGFREGEFERQYITRCINEAHQGSIERSILQNVRKREDWRRATVVWGLFKARQRLSFSVLPLIQSGLSRWDPQFEDGLIPYVNFLVAGGHLRQDASVLSYRHPRVELGLEQAAMEKPQLSSRALRYVVGTLTSKEIDPAQDWGPEGAVQLVGSVRRHSSLDLGLDGPVQSALDRWLQQRLSTPGATFEDDLRLAAVVGSCACSVAELARWLTHMREREETFPFDLWSAPAVSAQWYEWIRADAATQGICAAFIHTLLAFDPDQSTYRDDFVDHLRGLSHNLTAAFRDAALSIAADGRNWHAGLIAYGALADIEAFEVVVSRCLDYQASLHMAQWDEEWLAVINGNLDGPAESAAEWDDRGETAGTFVRAYVAERRRGGGWRALCDHARVAELLPKWISTAEWDGLVEDDEFLVLAELARKMQLESEFWELADRHWRDVLAPLLTQRVLDGGEEPKSLSTIVRTFAHNLSAEAPRIAATLCARGDEGRLIALAAHLGSAELTGSGEEVTEVEEAAAADERRLMQSVLESLACAAPAPLGEAIRAIVAVAPAPPSTEALVHIRTLDAGGDKLLKLAQSRVLAAAGLDITASIVELLTPARDSQNEVAFGCAALELAIRAQLWHCIDAALQHRFADVRVLSLNALPGRTSGALPARLLAAVKDKSHRVRQALVDLLSARRDIEHNETLVALAADTWTPDQYYPGEVRYPIARRAAEILLQMPALSEADISSIMDIATHSEDVEVAQTLFEVVLRGGSNDARHKVVRVALRTGAPPYHRIAAAALLAQARYVEPELVRQITTAQLLRRAPIIAVRLTLLVGARGADDQVLAAARALAASTRRRALLVPLYRAAIDRGIPAAGSVLQLLPSEFASQLELAVRGEGRLADDAFDSLGDPGIVEAIATC